VELDTHQPVNELPGLFPGDKYDRMSVESIPVVEGGKEPEGGSNRKDAILRSIVILVVSSTPLTSSVHEK